MRPTRKSSRNCSGTSRLSCDLSVLAWSPGDNSAQMKDRREGDRFFYSVSGSVLTEIRRETCGGIESEFYQEPWSEAISIEGRFRQDRPVR